MKEEMPIYKKLDALRETKPKNKKRLCSSSEIFEYIKFEMLYCPKELVFCIFMDSKCQVIKKKLMFEGGLNYCIIEIRNIIKEALDCNANSIHLVHNHPSGDSTPSKEDIEITNKLNEGCEFMGIRLLDHLVIGEDYFSFFDNNLL